MCMHSAECCPVYCLSLFWGKGRESYWPQWKIFHLRLYGVRLEMTFFPAEFVQLIISRSDSELEVQRLLVTFSSRCCYVRVIILNEFACACRFIPSPSPVTTPAWVFVAARVRSRASIFWCQRRRNETRVHHRQYGSVAPAAPIYLNLVMLPRTLDKRIWMLKLNSQHRLRSPLPNPLTKRLSWVCAVHLRNLILVMETRVAPVKRQTLLHWRGRQVLSQVTYVVEYLGTRNKAQRVVCLLFSMSRLRSLWSLPPLLACHFTSSRRSPCVYTSPPVQGMHACVRVGAPAVWSYASEAKWKPNEIHHVGRWTVMRQREKPSWNREYRFFENRTAETEFSFFEFWGRFGSVRFLWKPISEIFIGFRTPLGKSRQK